MSQRSRTLTEKQKNENEKEVSPASSVVLKGTQFSSESPKKPLSSFLIKTTGSNVSSTSANNAAANGRPSSYIPSFFESTTDRELYNSSKMLTKSARQPRKQKQTLDDSDFDKSDNSGAWYKEFPFAKIGKCWDQQRKEGRDSSHVFNSEDGVWKGKSCLTNSASGHQRKQILSKHSNLMDNNASKHPVPFRSTRKRSGDIREGNHSYSKKSDFHSDFMSHIQSSFTPHKNEDSSDVFVSPQVSRREKNSLISSSEKESKKLNEKQSLSATESSEDEEEIEKNYNKYRGYIESSIKAIDLVTFYKHFQRVHQIQIAQLQKTDPLAATRLALDLMRENADKHNKFSCLMQALTDAGYPKLVRILKGNLIPKNDKNRTKIQNSSQYIIQMLSIKDVAVHLYSKEVLNETDMEEIEATDKTGGRGNAAIALLLILPNRNRNWFEYFVEALVESSQTHLAEIIDAGLTRKIQQNIGCSPNRVCQHIQSDAVSTSTVRSDGSFCNSENIEVSPELSLDEKLRLFVGAVNELGKNWPLLTELCGNPKLLRESFHSANVEEMTTTISQVTHFLRNLPVKK